MIDLSSTFHGLGKSNSAFRVYPAPTVSQPTFTGSIYEIDSSITLFEQLLSTSSRSNPRRLPSVLVLALLRYKRYELSNQSEDYDKSIIHLTESILLPPRSPSLELGRMILFFLFFIAPALVKHSEASNQPEGVIYAAKYLRYLRDHPHGVSGLSRQAVTASLVDALAYQVGLEARNVMQCIEEMAVLCHELLTLEASEDHTTSSITRFAGVVSSKITQWAPDQPLDQVIECLRLARERRPDVCVARISLAWSLICRYITTFVNNDYEEAVSILNEFIASSSAGDDEVVTEIQTMVTRLAMIRSMAHGTPEYLEEAIYRVRTFPGVSPLKDPFAAYTEGKRFRFFGSIEGPETSPGNSLSSRTVQIEPKIETVMLLEELRSGICNLDITEIGEAVEKGRTVLASAPTDLPTSIFLYWFGLILFEAFKRTNKIEYLNESISTLRQVYEHPSSLFLRFQISEDLSRFFLARFTSFPGHGTQDLDEMGKIFSQCANNALVSLPTRFQHSCRWAYIARLTLHPSVSKAYESAVSLMQDTLLFSPTLQQQHATLADPFFITYPVSLDYASYQVDLHRLEEAVETLERGRALLWSEMRHLRASIDQLQQEHPQLGREFGAISKDLEELTKSIPPSHKLSIDDDAADNSKADDLKAVDPFGRLLLKQRELLKERDNLTSRIRALPGFDSFLKSPSFDTLRSAASSGPVILINHSEFRSDILILLHNTSPSLIPTSDDFYDRASALKNKLLDSRLKYGLDSSHYDETLASVLAELYDLVGKPVIDRLDQLQVPRQSRVWWCPTSVFCSLPLHAMGPIPSDDGEKRYFLDLYICSYTPTLSALIQSRNRDSVPQSSDRPSLLLVAQPDPSLPTVGGEIQLVQSLDTEVTSLISEAATPAAVIDGFHRHPFVHFACHGTLETGKPFEAGFELYGERLTLLEIVRSRLPTAEFAFLSACHTAEVTEGSVVEEGLHLAAAVQYCGFRSVVGTTWAMVDEDGRDLAKHFYKALFSNSGREQGVPYHEGSAKALQFAVKKLRRKRRITLERWVNFVHYGA
ncbi:CHAT domain-containing protein [Lactarius pseudohatsudake]|nr:CHAT domain-containing protein [Lactarius pseudohatsudake]